MLLLQALGVAEGEGVESGVRRLLAAGHQEVVVEQLGGEVHYGLVGAVVLAQHDRAGAVAGVEVVEALQEGYVESLLPCVVRVHLRADLKRASLIKIKKDRKFIRSGCLRMFAFIKARYNSRDCSCELSAKQISQVFQCDQNWINCWEFNLCG